MGSSNSVPSTTTTDDPVPTQNNTGYPEGVQFICNVTFSHATHTYDGRLVQYLHVDLGDFLKTGNSFSFGCLSADDHMYGRNKFGGQKSKVADIQSSIIITAHTHNCAGLVDKLRSNFLFCSVIKMEVTTEGLVVLTLQGGKYGLGPAFNTSKSSLNLKYKSDCTQMELVKSDFDSDEMKDSGTLTYRLPAHINPDGYPVKLYER